MTNKKEALKQWKAKHRAEARAKLPLPNEQMQAFFDMLDVELPKQGCDHSLRLTRAWLEVQHLPVEKVMSWLNENGGFCDCEALANAEECWRDAIQP
jgi:hypothetical protein